MTPPGPTHPHVPQRFVDRLLVHVYSAATYAPRVPLLLGIQGPSGDGKSYQCRTIAAHRGITLWPISSSALADEFEGKPVERLRDLYVKAGMHISQTDSPGFLLLEDFDMGIAGVHEGTTYTVNTQLLTGFLMNLCDDPRLSSSLRRSVPVVLTGNNLAVLHRPLTRYGRMRIFDWVPTRAERGEIVAAMLGLGSDDAFKLLDRFMNLPLAFFADLRAEVASSAALDAIHSVGPLSTLSHFEKQMTTAPKATLERLIELAELLREDHVGRDFVDNGVQ